MLVSGLASRLVEEALSDQGHEASEEEGRQDDECEDTGNHEVILREVVLGLDCQTEGDSATDHASVCQEHALFELERLFSPTADQESILDEDHGYYSCDHNQHELDAYEGDRPVAARTLEDAEADVRKDESFCEITE